MANCSSRVFGRNGAALGRHHGFRCGINHIHTTERTIRRWSPAQQLQHADLLRHCAASGSDDLDIAVFRFTLGIPGFDDSLIPRIIGFAGLAILFINHVQGQSIIDISQVRAELIGCVLAGLCIAVPAVSRELTELTSGKGRKGNAGELAGSRQMFELAEDLDQGTKQELAWASYALMKNTNTSGVLLFCNGKVLMARGAITDQAKSLVTLSDRMQRLQTGKEELGSQFYSDPDAIEKSGFSSILPEGAQSCLAVRVNSKQIAFLLSWAGSIGALSKRDRQWTTNVADKLSGISS